jgi:hypothetical protein
VGLDLHEVLSHGGDLGSRARSAGSRGWSRLRGVVEETNYVRLLSRRSEVAQTSIAIAREVQNPARGRDRLFSTLSAGETSVGAFFRKVRYLRGIELLAD